MKGDASHRKVATTSATVTVHSSCDLGSHTSNIGGVKKEAKSGVETRPKNMNVIYIIRVY